MKYWRDEDCKEVVLKYVDVKRPNGPSLFQPRPTAWVWVDDKKSKPQRGGSNPINYLTLT